jgi:hypothetical protein
MRFAMMPCRSGSQNAPGDRGIFCQSVAAAHSYSTGVELATRSASRYKVLTSFNYYGYRPAICAKGVMAGAAAIVTKSLTPSQVKAF